MNHIFLVGFMGAGKTTVGRYLAQKMNRELIDTDDMAVKFEGCSIPNIFKRSGEGYFRRLENMLLKNIKDMEPSVVSCGGGVAIRQENVDVMKSCGKVVYLKANPETILERVSRSNNRPLLEGKKNIEDITALMEKRVAYYETAADIQVVVDQKKADEIADEISCLVDF